MKAGQLIMQQPDWSLLYPELLQSIAEKNPCIIDYIYFRAVCRRWRLATLSKPRHLPPQLPWLLLPVTTSSGILKEPELLFCDLWQSRVCTLSDHVLQGSRICGASRGWIILEKNQKVTLLNPVTRANIPVSSLSGVPSIFPTPEKSKLCPTELIIEEAADGGSYMRKAILTSTPLHTGCMVVGLFTSNWELAFCRIGDEHWTVIEERGRKFFFMSSYFEDIVWHHDKLYAILPIGGVYIYDLHSPSKLYVDSNILPVSYKSLNLVEGASKLMVVARHGMQTWLQEPYHSLFKYELFEWRNYGQPQWSKVCDIEEVLLFINSAGVCISIPSAKLQSNRWHGNGICAEIWDLTSRISLQLNDLRHGGVEIIHMKNLVPRCNERPLWITPSYF